MKNIYRILISFTILLFASSTGVSGQIMSFITLEDPYYLPQEGADDYHVYLQWRSPDRELDIEITHVETRSGFEISGFEALYMEVSKITTIPNTEYDDPDSDYIHVHEIILAVKCDLMKYGQFRLSSGYRIWTNHGFFDINFAQQYHYEYSLWDAASVTVSGFGDSTVVTIPYHTYDPSPQKPKIVSAYCSSDDQISGLALNLNYSHTSPSYDHSYYPYSHHYRLTITCDRNPLDRELRAQYEIMTDYDALNISIIQGKAEELEFPSGLIFSLSESGSSPDYNYYMYTESGNVPNFEYRNIEWVSGDVIPHLTCHIIYETYFVQGNTYEHQYHIYVMGRPTTTIVPLEGVYRVNTTMGSFDITVRQVSREASLSSQHRWIKTTMPLTAGGTGTSSVLFFDGFGRPSQSINLNASPTGGNIVSSTVYDHMGREDSVSYLPFVSKSAILPLANPVGEQQDYYKQKYPGDPDRNYTYTRTGYDNTSLGRALYSYDAGESNRDNPVSYEYRLNAANDYIKKFSVLSSGAFTASGYYEPNLLTVHSSYKSNNDNEASVKVLQYTNGKGQVLVEEEILGGTKKRTYYIYDDLGRQRYIIPPIQESQLSATGTYTYDDLKKYCYYMVYDKYGRVSQKYVPGTEPVWYVYDKRGRLVLSQNGEERAKGQWSFIKYDIHDRTILSGLLTSSLTQAQHITELDRQTNFGESYGSTGSAVTFGYTNNCYPAVSNQNDIFSVVYYDNYNWQENGDSYGFRADGSINNVNLGNITGLVTGTRTKVLGIDNPQWLTGAIYYDDRYHTIQTVTDLYPSGTEVVYNSHNFTGKVVMTKVRQATTAGVHEYNKWFEYDDWGRLLSIDQQVTGDTGNGRITLVSYDYDDRGSVVAKYVHNGSDVTTYENRMSGRQEAALSEHFSYKLTFDRLNGMALNYSYNKDTRLDGLLSSVQWTDNPNGPWKAYKYQYYREKQLASTELYTKSTVSNSWQSSDAFFEGDYGYDNNGNIHTLSRTASNGSMLHWIEYEYDGNQLTTVDFTDYSQGTRSGTYGFSYDANGNMTYDGMNGVGIEYNALNLPQRIFAGNDEIRYIYSAKGEKLASWLRPATAAGSLTYYRSVMVYACTEGSTAERLQYMAHPEGVIRYTQGSGGNSYVYNYFKTDHLGNTRVVLEAVNSGGRTTMTPVQKTDYYPYGLAWSHDNLNVNRHLFGGKELQDAGIGNLGMLGYYDFHARFYNPILGQWFNPDPALQLANPYLYCGNNPVNFVDPDGEWILLASAIVGAYLGGSAANNSFNPGKWHYRSGATWAGMLGGAFQGVSSVVGLQAGFAQMGWNGLATFGRSGSAANFLTSTIKTSNYSGWLTKVGMGTVKGLAITNAAVKSLNMTAALSSLITHPKNAGKIIMGNYYYNPRRTFMGQLWEGVSRGTYEGIQQSLGSAIGHARNTFGKVTNVEFFDGATLINYNNNSYRHRGMTLGSMINSKNLEANTGDPMFMHEYGHTQQSKWLGPLYPFIVGIPSAISSSGSPEKHSTRWYEKWANSNAKRYFKRYGVDWNVIQTNETFRSGETKYPTY